MRSFLHRFAITYLKLVGATALLFASMMGTYVLMNWARIFPQPDEIVIYGNDRCGFTSAMREELEAVGISYHYGDLDLVLPDYELTGHLSEEANQRTVHLPIVLVGGLVLERPGTEEVLRLVGRAQ